MVNKLQKESEKEIKENLKKIKKFEKEFKDKLKLETDTGFYFQIVFKSKEEMNKFLEKKKIKLNYNDFIFFEDIQDLFI